MNSEYETKKRLDIAEAISSQLNGIVKCVVLGGSMGFGQNYSVTEKSDIDMVVVCDKEKIDYLVKAEHFNGCLDDEELGFFKEGEINFFWVTKKIDGVESNAFVYETGSYTDFCLLKGTLCGFRHSEPAPTQAGFGFAGDKVIFNRNVRKFRSGFLYDKPALADGKYLGLPPRQDFICSNYILYEENSFFSKLEIEVWKSSIGQLKKEYGEHPDLTKYNLLNVNYTYQTARQRMPTSVIEKIIKRTQEELNQ